MSVEPCGSWRVLRYIEGNAAEERWCERIDGPCPFPGTDKEQSSERRCATEPGTVLRVKWADGCIDDALVAFKRYAEGEGIAPMRASQEVAVVLDALRTCGATEPVCNAPHERWSTCPLHGHCSCATEVAAPRDHKCPLHGESIRST